MTGSTVAMRAMGSPTEYEQRYAHRRFDGDVAVVTGSASGIGRATAVRLGLEGAAVACLDINGEGASATAATIVEAGGQAVGLPCDVRASASVAEAVEAVRGRLGPVRVACNVAGVGMFTHATDITDELWDRVIGVNLTGTFFVCRAVLPDLLEQGGVIINVASTAGLAAQAYSAHYCASKGGVIALTKALAVEYAGRNVRVNAVAPGGVKTAMYESFTLPEGVDLKHIEAITSRLGATTPDRIGAVIAFLASEESDYTTGSIVVVDGAITA